MVVHDFMPLHTATEQSLHKDWVMVTAMVTESRTTRVLWLMKATIVHKSCRRNSAHPLLGLRRRETLCAWPGSLQSMTAALPTSMIASTCGRYKVSLITVQAPNIRHYGHHVNHLVARQGSHYAVAFPGNPAVFTGPLGTCARGVCISGFTPAEVL